jgi:hypothetical protein
VRRAFRVREAAAQLRRWLVRGTPERLATGSSAVVATSDQQWRYFGVLYKKCLKSDFPDFLGSQLLTLTLNRMGSAFRLAATEARELILLVAPRKNNGRVLKADLQDFISRSCRSFGEMVALLQRGVLRPLYMAYEAHCAAIMQRGKEDFDLAEHYQKIRSAIVLNIETANDPKVALSFLRYA